LSAIRHARECCFAGRFSSWMNTVPYPFEDMDFFSVSQACALHDAGKRQIGKRQKIANVRSRELTKVNGSLTIMML
jgi:hypothetical protein